MTKQIARHLCWLLLAVALIGCATQLGIPATGPVAPPQEIAPRTFSVTVGTEGFSRQGVSDFAGTVIVFSSEQPFHLVSSLPLNVSGDRGQPVVLTNVNPGTYNITCDVGCKPNSTFTLRVYKPKTT